MTIKLTWVHAGTNNAAMLGLDEIVEADSTDEAEDAAFYAAECQGVDIDKYELRSEVIDEGDE